MPRRIERTFYCFTLGPAIRKIETSELARLAHSQVQLAEAAVMSAERPKALARLAAASEALSELRQRGEQLRL